MLRLVEFGWFLLPFLFYALWRYGSPRTRPWHLGLAGVAVLVMALYTGWLALEGGIPAGQRYVPPSLEQGRIVPGHGVAP